MAGKLYSVKINASGRYVRHCDDCWYETENTELRLFTREQAERIRKQLRNHYVYSVTISNGDETITDECPIRKKATQVEAPVVCSEDSGWGEGIEW